MFPVLKLVYTYSFSSIFYLYFYLFVAFWYLYALILYIYLYLCTFCPLFAFFWYLYALSSWCYTVFSLCFLHYIAKEPKNFSKIFPKKSQKSCWHYSKGVLFLIQQKHQQHKITDWLLIINISEKKILKKLLTNSKKLCYS